MRNYKLAILRRSNIKSYSPRRILKVKYVYVLSDWFKHKSYKDVLDYINSVGCHYFFEILPFDFLGLPVSK